MQDLFSLATCFGKQNVTGITAIPSKRYWLGISGRSSSIGRRLGPSCAGRRGDSVAVNLCANRADHRHVVGGHAPAIRKLYLSLRDRRALRRSGMPQFRENS